MFFLVIFSSLILHIIYIFMSLHKMSLMLEKINMYNSHTVFVISTVAHTLFIGTETKSYNAEAFLS